MSFGTLQQIAVPEDAVVAKGILILQITAAAPFQYLHPQCIFPGGHKIRDVELRLQMASLGKAHIVAIHIHKAAGGHALQNEIHPSPDGIQGKIPFVDATGVFIRHIGRVTGIGVVDVAVIGVLVPLQLPAGGNRNGIPI